MGKRLDAVLEGLASGKSGGTATDTSYGPKTTAFLDSLAQPAGQFPKNAFSDTLPQGVAGPVRNDRITPAYRQAMSHEDNYGPAGGNIDTSKDYLPLSGDEWSTPEQYQVGVNDRKYTILDEGGKFIIIPMVDAGRMSPQLTDREAIELYRKTGKNYGTFESHDAASAYLDVLKAKDRARRYDAGTLTDREAVYAEMDKRDLQKRERMWRENFGNADNNFLQAAGLGAISGFNTTVTGLANVIPELRNNRDIQNHNKAINNVSAEERQQIGEKSAVLGTAYDLWQNFAMNAPAMAAGGVTGMPIVGSAVIFASSFGNDLKYAEEGGHDPKRAYAYAFLDGLNQAALDYLGSLPGVSKIGKALEKIRNPILKFSLNTAKEGVTEDLQTVVENWLKNVILGEHNDIRPWSEEALYSALLGFLSAVTLNAPTAALDAKQTMSVGNSFIKNGKIGDAIQIGLSNVKSSEEYQTAAKMATEMTEGKNPSAYQLGELVIQSMSDTASTARSIDGAVRRSAQDAGVSDDVAETVAAVAVRFSKKVLFVPSNDVILQADSGSTSGAAAAAVGAYDSASNTIFLNADTAVDSTMEFVLKHELTHGIEKTSMWKSLRRVARQQMGDTAFDAEVSRIQSRRAAVGETLDAAGAEKEVVANFVGNNLFTENFAEAITRQDTKLSSVFAGTFYRLRYAMDAIRNGRQAARMQYAEHLFTAALDKTPGTVRLNVDTDGDADAEGETQFSAARNDDQRYSYEELVKKPDMPVVYIGGAEEVEGLTRKQIIDKAKENAKKVGTENEDLHNVSVHVNDTDTDVIVSADGLRHGLDRRFQTNAGVTIHAGEILKNSVCINEIVSKKAGATGAYILVGAAENSTGNLYIVEFVVNRYSRELVTMDVLYSLNAKKEGTAVLNAPGVSTPRYRSTISISKLLEYVNRKFPDVLSMDVLQHFGRTERPSGELGSAAVYSFADDAEGEAAYGFDEKTQNELTAEYQKEVDQVLNMQNTKRDNLIIGYTPKLMQQMGMPSLPFVIGTGHVYSAAKTETEARQDGNYRKGVHYHGLGAETVKNIYEKLQDPVMIIASKDASKNAVPLRSTHSVVAIVDVGEAGKHLLLPVEVTAERTVNGEQMDVNVLSSAYQKNVQGLVREAIAMENSGDAGVYYAKKEATTLIPAGVQFPIRIQEMITSNPIIRNFDEKVNMKIVDATQSQQFKRWFGDWQNHPEDASKVVNEDGTPKVVYHGTNEDFTVFDSKSGVYWFSETKEYAEAKTKERGGDRVVSAYLSMQNPLYAKLSLKEFSDPAHEAPLVRQAKEGGYDGVIIETDVAPENPSHEKFYAVFSSNQIKSATDNIGTFSRNNPDIQHAFADDADGGVAVKESAKKDSKVQPDADAYTAYRIAQDMELADKYRDAVKEREQTSEEASPVEEVTQMVEGRKAEKQTKFQKKQEAAREDLRRRWQNGALTDEAYDAELAKLTGEAVAENDRKWKSGNRGDAAMRQAMGEEHKYTREKYIQKEVEQERQERREKAAAAEEKKEKTALQNKVIRLMNEAKDRLAHPQKNRHIPLQHTQTIIDLLQAIMVNEEEKQRYIAAAREKLGDAVYPATKTRYENQIKKAMDSGDAVSRQLDRLAMVYKELQKSDTMKCAYAPELDAVISGFAESIRGKTLSDMTMEELDTAADIVQSVMYAEENARVIPAGIFGDEAVAVDDIVPDMIAEIRQSTVKVPRAVKNFQMYFSDPIATFNMLGGWHKNSLWSKLGNSIVRESTYREMEVVAKFNELFREAAQDKDFQKGMEFSPKNMVDGIGLVDAAGNAVSISRGTMLALYAHLGCDSNLEEIMTAGLQVPDLKAYYKGENNQAYVDGKKVGVSGSNAAKINSLRLDLQDAVTRANELRERYYALREEMQTDMRADAAGAAETTAEIDGKELKGRKVAIRDAYYELQEAETTESKLQQQYDAAIRRERQRWLSVRDAIDAAMTKTEKAYMEKVSEWFNEHQKGFINEPYMNLYGIPRATVKNYFPRHRMMDLVHHSVESIRVDRSLENLGMLKERVKDSPVPILLTDITYEMREALDATAQFYGYAEATKTLQKVLGYIAPKAADSTQLAFDEVFGKSKVSTGVSMKEYFDNLLADMNGARQGSSSTVDKALNFIRNNTVRAAIAANFRVFGSQFSAVFQIPSVIGWESFQKGMARAVHTKAPVELMRQYSAAWASRSANNIAGMEEIADARSGNMRIDKLYRKVDEATGGWLLNLSGKADAIATGGVVWFSCEEAVKATHPELKVGSEEYYKAVGKLQDQVIFETQPDEHIMNRSELQRQTGSLIKLVTLFKAQPLKILNQLVTAYNEMVVYSKDLKEGKHGVTKEDVKEKKEKFARVTAYSVVMSTVAYVALRGLTNALLHNLNGYRDDDGELNAGSIAGAMGMEAISQIADLVPFGGQVYEVVAAQVLGEKYYGLDDNALEAVGNILSDIANGNFKNPATYNKLIGDLSSALGIPYKNISSTVRGILYHAEDIKNGEFLSFKAGSGVSMTQTYRQLYKAMASGKTEKAQSLREYLLTSGKTAAEIESGIRAAIRSDNADAKKQAERAIEEAMTNMYFDSFTEKEQSRVESSLRSFYADKVFSQAGGDMTAANEKAEKAVEKGVSAADYFVAQVLKNARFADKNGDGKVNKAEYRTLVDDMECTERVKQILKTMK